MAESQNKEGENHNKLKIEKRRIFLPHFRRNFRVSYLPNAFREVLSLLGPIHLGDQFPLLTDSSDRRPSKSF